MFDRILIANRGEIACRIIGTARRMGIEVVAVHSRADADAMHVALADQSVCIGEASPAESYLRGERVIEAALASGAQAIHPGYGFLSEDWRFVADVEKAGLAFIGPAARTVASASRKDEAKRIMAEAGVPVVPGTEAVDAKAAAQAAQEIGFPVLIKAVAGGGGRGMRMVVGDAGFASAFASAAREALAAFGDDSLFVEKLILSPRHIEVQIFGDQHGNHLHLFERDCSLQRRHQKIIEEAPAPGMRAELRAELGAMAVRAARAVSYVGAGTVEFILDGSDGLRADRSWFIEMNTRLQVEHPVTEAITGLDLVEWQLRVAAGEPLPVSQDELRLDGHAIEARLCCEDAADGGRPAVGRIRNLVWPPDVRIDSGVRDGDVVSPHYDSMIAKIIAAAPDREAARRLLLDALASLRLDAPATNAGLLEASLGHRQFIVGGVQTDFLEQELKVGDDTPPPTAAWALAAAAAHGAPARQGAGFVLWHPLERRLRLTSGTHVMDLVVRAIGDDMQVEMGEAHHLCSASDGRWQLPGGDGIAWSRGPRICVSCDGYREFSVVDPLVGFSGHALPLDHVEAPMPGLLRKVAVRVGNHVRAGDVVAILEAMKMEHALTAPRDGVVARLCGTVGEAIEAGQPIVEFEALPGAASDS